jgi:hypothetical protein
MLHYVLLRIILQSMDEFFKNGFIVDFWTIDILLAK